MGMTWMWWWNVQDRTVVGTGSEVSGPGERGQGILMLAPVRLARFVKREPSGFRPECGAMTAPRAREQADPPSPPDRLPSRRGGRPSSQTVAAGRPAGFARLAGARCGFLRPARALAAAALLALTGALALPISTAEAQTATTLVSNVGQSPVGAVMDVMKLAQVFITGPNEDGYTLTGVDIVSASSSSFTAMVCATLTPNPYPTSPCEDLTPPGSFAVGTMSFTAPADTTLTKDTTYAVVVDAAEIHVQHGRVQGWSTTTSDSEDMGHDDEWSIRDSYYRNYGPGATDWAADGPALLIAIKGYAAVAEPPEPDTTSNGSEVASAGTTLSLAFDGPLATANLPPASAFTVTAGGVSIAIGGVSVDSSATVGGVSLSGLDPAILQGQTVELTYTDPTTGDDTNALQTVAGADVRTFTVTLTNNSTVTVTIENVEVTSTPMLESDTYGAGETIQFTVTFTAAVDVTGDPVFTFSLGNSGVGNIRNVDAAYESGSGTAALVFGYTVVSTDVDDNGIYQLGGSDFASRDGPVDLDSDDSITFTGTSTDAVLAYATRVQRSDHKVDGSRTSVASTDATLSGLAVNDGSTDLTLTPTFVSGMYAYAASVASTVTEVTVTAMTTDSGAMIEYLDAGNMTLTGVTGHQVAVGDTIIKVKVTAEDGDTTQTYTVTVNRAAAMPPTCTLNTGDLWCGVVAVGQTQLSDFGVTAYGFIGAVGDLSDNDSNKTFAIGANSYTIDRVTVGTLVAGVEGYLTFSLTSALTATDKENLVLHVGSASFAFSDRLAHSEHHYQWSSTLDWSSESTVTLRLREAPQGPAAPTNFMARPAGDAKVALSWDAPASGSGVMRHEYQFKTDGSYGNWTRIANSAVGGANQAGFTVPGLTNEVPHTFQLRAVSAAGDGAAAEAGPVTPTPGICDRTQQVQDEILGELSGVDDCAEVTVADLATIPDLYIERKNVTALKSGDFAGLSALENLSLRANSLTELPSDLFSGLSALRQLVLNDNSLSTLPSDVFSGLSSLEDLFLNNNPSLGPLPAAVFSGLTSLQKLNLSGIGLETIPAGLFSGLSALTTIRLAANRLETLPAALFSGLAKMEFLVLSTNRLGTLPDGVFSGLSELTEIYLDENRLTELFGGGILRPDEADAYPVGRKQAPHASGRRVCRPDRVGKPRLVR